MATKKKMLQAAAGNAGEALNVEDVFSTYLYTGNGSTQTITNGIDLDGEGGLVWFKKRDSTYNHVLQDTARGAGVDLYSNLTVAEIDYSGSYGIDSFNSDGFSLIGAGTATNQSGGDYASWTFRKAPKFFTCVQYTGNGGTQSISHNLGSVPAFIITKRTDSTGSWLCYHTSLGAGQQIFLDLTQAANSNTNTWQNTTPTDSVFYLGNNAISNASGGTYVAYLFAHNDGDGEFGPDGNADIIKCGSYTGTGSAGNEVDLGFEPQWVMVKRTDSADDWEIYDTMRGMPYSTSGDMRLKPNDTQQEVGVTTMSPTSTGFVLEGGGGSYNVSGGSYIYMAIRRGTKVPESATEVFALDTQNSGSYSSPPYHRSGFVTDAAMRLYRTGGSSSYPFFSSRLTGPNNLVTSSSASEVTSSNVNKWDYMNGWGGPSVSSSTTVVASPMWKRAPGFFDAVAYTGNSTAGRTVSHNLGVAPEMIWTKSRSNSLSWSVYHSGISNNGTINLNTTAAADPNDNGYDNTAPTDTVYYLGNSTGTNENNYTYIAYLFASLPGISKVGSYTGDGTSDSSKVIDCGFTSGARFVLIKAATGEANNWFVFDTVRGIVSGFDPRIFLNLTSAEATNADYIDPHNSGFIVGVASNTVNSVNVSGVTYIFYAIA